MHKYHTELERNIRVRFRLFSNMKFLLSFVKGSRGCVVKFSSFTSSLVALLVTVPLGACWAPLPVVDLEFSDPSVFRGYVEAIVRHVGCELGQSVQVEFSPDYPETYDLRKWAAKIALTLRAKNSLGLNGSTSIFSILSTANFSAGLGSQADATREIVITYFITFDELLRRQYKRHLDGKNFVSCSEAYEDIYNSSTTTADYLKRPIMGNLGIGLTLKTAMETWTTPGLLSSRIQNGPFETVTHHVTFEVKLNANANPALQFSNVSANIGGRLADASRTDTNEMQISMGPLVLGTRSVVPSKALDDAFYTERLRNILRRDN